VSTAPIQQQFDAAMQHHQAGRLGEAEMLYRQILAADPKHAPAMQMLGLLAQQCGHIDDAIELLRQSAGLQPTPEASYNLGLLLVQNDEIEEAIGFFHNAVALRPNFVEAITNLGNALAELNRTDEAIALFERALAIRPDFAQARWNLSLAHLIKGDYAAGWNDYEARWAVNRLTPGDGCPQPLWDGSDLKGRTILLRAEQGLGDTIQFVRFAPTLAARGGRVIVQCPPALVRLLRTCPAVEQVVGNDQLALECDVQCPMMSVARVLRATPQTPAATVPYLHADPADAATWRARLAQEPGLKVGLVWAGNPAHKSDRQRSTRLDRLAALAQTPGVRWVSLQKGVACEQLARNPAFKMIDWVAELKNFADAALIANLDLIITVDTATAHLAGAMGKPTWLLLKFAPDWRWGLGRSETPWYPTMRLFRQRVRGDWEGVAREVAEELRKLTNVQ
jgi:tetratricopeptide (TPR) repeat protein